MKRLPLLDATLLLISSFASAQTGKNLADDAALNVSLATMQRLISRQVTPIAALQSGEVKVEGSAAVLAKFYSFFDALTTPEPPPLTVR